MLNSATADVISGSDMSIENTPHRPRLNRETPPTTRVHFPAAASRNRAKSRLAFAKSCRHCALAGSFWLSSVIIATICSKRRIASGKSPRCSANKPSLA